MNPFRAFCGFSCYSFTSRLVSIHSTTCNVVDCACMGRKAKAKRETTTPRRSVTAIRHPLRAGPNWPLLVLSVLGIFLASYLSWTDWVGNHLKGCAVGSSCDIVLSSSWARLLGFPTAFWGLMAYLTLAATAFIRRTDRHWWAAWGISFFGVLYSAYLTTVSLTLLHAACPYCLTSLALMTSIFALVTYQRPAVFQDFSWPRWLTRTAPIAVGIILVLHLNYTGILGEPPAPEDPEARALAIHLVENRREDVRRLLVSSLPAAEKRSSARQPADCLMSSAARTDKMRHRQKSAKLSTFKAIQPGSSTGSISRKFSAVKQLADDSGFQPGIQTSQIP